MIQPMLVQLLSSFKRVMYSVCFYLIMLTKMLLSEGLHCVKISRTMLT